jgi:hypothetical protein
MGLQTESGEKSTLQELAEIRAAAKNQASVGGEEAELPVGDDPVVEEVEPEVEEPPAPVEEPDVEEMITIGDREFKTQKEAIKYAESLAHDKELLEAHSAGVQEALRVSRPEVAAPPVEDDFEARFYSDPKGTLKEMEERATTRAVAAMNAETNKEKLWAKFFDLNPDLEGQRPICEHVLSQHWDTIGKITDLDKAMKVIATKTRTIFQDYIDRSKPRTELANKSGQVVSTGSTKAPGVTPKNKVEVPLTLSQQIRNIRRRV